MLIEFEIWCVCVSPQYNLYNVFAICSQYNFYYRPRHRCQCWLNLRYDVFVFPINIICIYNVFALNITFIGLVTEDIFYSIFSKFFPLGGDTYNGGWVGTLTMVGTDLCNCISWQSVVCGHGCWKCLTFLLLFVFKPGNVGLDVSYLVFCNHQRWHYLITHRWTSIQKIGECFCSI